MLLGSSPYFWFIIHLFPCCIHTAPKNLTPPFITIMNHNTTIPHLHHTIFLKFLVMGLYFLCIVNNLDTFLLSRPQSFYPYPRKLPQCRGPCLQQAVLVTVSQIQLNQIQLKYSITLPDPGSPPLLLSVVLLLTVTFDIPESSTPVQSLALEIALSVQKASEKGGRHQLQSDNLQYQVLQTKPCL